MSHFTVTVALPADLDADELEGALESALAPFNEELPVERYMEYTREELIEQGRRDIAAIEQSIYAKYLANPAEYLATATKEQAEFITGSAENGGFPARLAWTDTQIHAHQIKFYDTDDVDASGNVFTTRNPDGNWDWWVIGGRWGGYWTIKDGAETGLDTQRSAFGMAEAAGRGRTDCARVGDIEAESLSPTHAFVDLDGEWHEQGAMGWFGISHGNSSDADWTSTYLSFISGLDREVWLVNVDAHI